MENLQFCTTKKFDVFLIQFCFVSSIMMSEAKLLKDRGNAAFKAKKFEEAIQLFKQAVIAEESLPTQDSKLLAILHSNVAQIYLELKK